MKNFASVFGPLYIARLGEMSGNYAGVLQAIVGDVLFYCQSLSTRRVEGVRLNKLQQWV